MKEELISFETAKLAKEEGFDEMCSYLFNDFGRELPKQDRETKNTSPNISGIALVSRPTQSLLQRWLREVHNIEIEVRYDNDMDGMYWEYIISGLPDTEMITKVNNKEMGQDGDLYLQKQSLDRSEVVYNNTYEEALEAGLNEALNLIEKL